MIKTFAEWENQEFLLLSLPHENTDWSPYLGEILDAYEDLVRSITPYQKILLIAPKKRDFDRFRKFCNVKFAQIPTNDTWIRDYGAIDIVKNNQKISLDFKFNAWGGKFEANLDNCVNLKLFEKLKRPLKQVNLELEGGSIDFNGRGVMLTTTQCLLNPNRFHTDKDALELKLKEIFGLERIIWLDHGFILGDDTDSHIDTLARFIDENTIAYAACDDKNDLHYSELKSMENELKKTGFNLVPLFIPRAIFYQNRRLGATYCNFIFVNNALILPSYGDEKYDEMAKFNLENAIKNRDIIQVRSEVFLRQNGSLHCSSQNVFKFKGKK